MESIEEVIRLRDEAIQKLLEEREHTEGKLKTLTARLEEIDEQLGRLGHATTPRVSSTATGWQPGKMEDGLYQRRYKGQTYTLRVQGGVGKVEGVEGEFHSFTAAAVAVKTAVTGRKMTAAGPRFWGARD